MPRIFLLYLLMWIAPCGYSQDKEIEELLVDYYETMSERDWEEYQTFFIEKAILVTIWDPENSGAAELYASGLDDFIAMTAEGPDSQPIFEERMTHSRIEVNGGLAVAWADYKAKFGTENNLMEWTGKDLFTLIRINDEWKIVSLTYLSD